MICDYKFLATRRYRMQQRLRWWGELALVVAIMLACGVQW